jgi:hypothetical protein
MRRGGATVTRGVDTTQAAGVRQQALGALFAYLAIDPQDHSLVLLTRFEVLPEAECSEGFYVTVRDAPYEVYRLLTGDYDIESSDDLLPTFGAWPDEEKMAQFACAVALHAHGLTFRETAEVEAHVSELAGHGTARRWRVIFRTPTDSTDRVTEVDEIAVGGAREFVALDTGEQLRNQHAGGSGRALLILGCSARKRSTPVLLPAIERYDGPLYRVLRKALREGNAPQPLDVLIISARYGVLRASDLIEHYDQRMTRCQAERLREEIGVRIAGELSSGVLSHAHISLGADYLAALGGTEVVTRSIGQVSVARGGLGQRQSQLRNWLLATRNALGGCSREDPRARL